MSDICGQKATECPACNGWGETEETVREMIRDPKSGVWRTIKMGSGCPRCGGTGQLEETK